VISDEIRRFAEDPSSVGDDPAQDSGFARVLTERYCVFFGPVFTNVQRLRISPGAADETVAELRALTHERKRAPRVDWWIGSSATPPGLGDRLLELGFTREKEATAAMACVEPPPEVEGIVARPVATLEEYSAAHRIAHETFGAAEEDRARWLEIESDRWGAEQADPRAFTYLAWLDGQPVASARGIFLDPGVLCIGGAVLERARGRSAYRALVRARWNDAVAAGTPALVVQAGVLSRPILERSGFVRVADIDILYDRGL
jgi:hypothetical protein